VLHSILLHFASELKWSRKMRLLSVFYFSFEISIACWLLSRPRPNWRIVSKLTTDVVTYCTEASNQKSKYAYRKILFYKKSTGIRTHNCNIQFSWRTDKHTECLWNMIWHICGKSMSNACIPDTAVKPTTLSLESTYHTTEQFLTLLAFKQMFTEFSI